MLQARTEHRKMWTLEVSHFPALEVDALVAKCHAFRHQRFGPAARAALEDLLPGDLCDRILQPAPLESTLDGERHDAMTYTHEPA